jgi:hypothetical protein
LKSLKKKEKMEELKREIGNIPRRISAQLMSPAAANLKPASFNNANANANGYREVIIQPMGQNALSDFMNSSSMVAKVAFLLFVVVVTIICIRVGIAIMGWYMSNVRYNRLIKGMVDGKQLIVIPQDPNENGANTIQRSVNQDEGIEFTWSVWIFIDDMTYNSDMYRCIFYKGNGETQNNNEKGLNFPNNSPGVYLCPHTNKLLVILNTYNVINEEIHIGDIPINKWLNVILRVEDNTADVYINGTITKSHRLHGVVKQNYSPIYVCSGGGFSGYLSELCYFSHALNLNEIQKLVKKGPDTHMSGSNNAMSMKQFDYLSLRWFFNGSRDTYNP